MAVLTENDYIFDLKEDNQIDVFIVGDDESYIFSGFLIDEKNLRSFIYDMDIPETERELLRKYIANGYKVIAGNVHKVIYDIETKKLKRGLPLFSEFLVVPREYPIEKIKTKLLNTLERKIFG
jgi:hypothetical protein